MKRKRQSCLLAMLLALAVVMVTQAHAGATSEGFFIQNYLPKELKEKLKVSLEMRYRLEARDDFDFSETADRTTNETDTFHLLRTRLMLDATISESLRGFVQLQDSRIFGTTPANRWSIAFRDEFDVRQAYIDYKIKQISDALTLRLGRQELSYGDQRLVGGFDWSNVAQSFDAAKVIFAQKQFTIEGFLSEKVNIDLANPNNWYDDNEGFHGVYTSYKGLDKHVLDMYYLYRNSSEPVSFGPSGSRKLNELTSGIRLKGDKVNNFDYTLEYAYQSGEFGSQDINAYALILQAGYTLSDIPWTPRLGLEWDFATGDEDSTDNERNTFDNLWPTNHLFYGYIDFVSLQNINAYNLRLNLSPTKKLSLQGDYWLFYLDETTDALYNAGRAQLRAANQRVGSGYVGSEVDFLLKYAFNKNINLLSGYSHFFAGTFLARTGANDDADFFYLQSLLKF
ncbi:MAG: hypothetical protein A2Y00_05005 [Omnitrophica WOR_2 bacterium GWF2_43_52]|nr:MAG: hypothetical protein A2Y01_01835 [Omnitrophica WOR_2 bacterium GWC2_44_8]OGX20466.1 MAG: hypothetical protein A2Y00_05005 [Omnitrophica WOR_2 bacterium GWF2_43_52]HAH20520.1 hypothetical protein [Candidatus Omnitrophota bacterium]HBG62783.1 hypothetical protein [Candidatus Omnitrophota bacterium]HCD38336.1 hypothetical protein [Candidatus Omnitrophota bacterium]